MRIGVGLSIPELATRGGRFSPASLFTSGVAGAWYDPSDYSTLFQDSAGTTPVTAVEQGVRLMLDKSQGLVLGSELVTNGDFSSGLTGWTNGSTGTGSATAPSGAAVLIGIDSSNAARISQGNTVVGKTYKVTFDLTMTSGTAVVEIGGTFRLFTTSGSRSYYEVATNTSGYVIRTPGGGGNFTIDNISVKELPGNHALAPNDPSRPILRARYNLLTYSEQFDNAVWSNSLGGTGVAATVTANQGTAPDGTATADRIQFNLGGGTTASDLTRRIQSYVTAAVPHTYSIYVRSYDGVSTYNMHIVGPTGGTTNIVVTGSWQRFEVSATGLGASAAYAIGLRGGQTPANSNTADVLAWGAQVVTGSSAGTYQRIAAATDYATAGFLPYLALSTDDSFSTNSIDFTATDKMSVCVGVTKNSDTTGFGIICELSGNTSIANPGSFGLFAPATGGTPSYHVGLARSAASLEDLTTYAAPITNVIFVGFDFAGASRATAIIPRVNGSTPTISGGANVAPGTGNFGNYPFYIGRRAGSSLPLEGRIYQLIVCGKTLSASELASTEAYVATKTGVTL